MKYYLYHIPGKKVGVTTNLENRVHKQQGYLPDEYDIIAESEDIEFISAVEQTMQKFYKYRVDEVPYNKLNFNKMKINVTEQTTTFPVPVNKLKGRLVDNIGMRWSTEHGDCLLTAESIKWIMKNVKTSMYNPNRSYIYNKAFAAFTNKPVNKITSKKPLKMFTNIRDWADQRGIYKDGDSKTQLIKLQEEVGELAKAVLENDKPEIVDAIGDSVVVLTNLAELSNLRIEDCIDSAYDEISNRKGKMINGTFVKTDGLSEAEITLLMDGHGD